MDYDDLHGKCLDIFLAGTLEGAFLCDLAIDLLIPFRTLVVHLLRKEDLARMKAAHWAATQLQQMCD